MRKLIFILFCFIPFLGYTQTNTPMDTATLNTIEGNSADTIYFNTNFLIGTQKLFRDQTLGDNILALNDGGGGITLSIDALAYKNSYVGLWDHGADVSAGTSDGAATTLSLFAMQQAGAVRNSIVIYSNEGTPLSSNITYKTENFHKFQSGVSPTESVRIDSTGLKLSGDLLLGATTSVSGILDEDDMSSNSAIDLATQQSIKTYVDGSVGVVVDYFFNNTASDIGGIYYDQTNVDLGGGESTLSTAGLSASTDDQALVNFATLSGEPGILSVPAGVFDVHFHAERTAGSSSANIYAEIYKRAAGGAETLITTTEISSAITAKAAFSIHGSTSTDVDLLVTDRIVVKFYANCGAGSGATIALYQEGTTTSRLTIPTTTSILSQFFLRRDGTVSMTGALNLSDNNMDSVGTITTDTEFTWHIGCFDFVSNGGAIDADYIPAEAAAHPKVINGSMYAPVNIPFNQFGGTVVLDQITVYYNTNANGDDFDFALTRADNDGSITVDEDQDDIGNGTAGAQSTTLLAADITLSDFAYYIEIDANNTDAAADVKIYDVKFECHLE